MTAPDSPGAIAAEAFPWPWLTPGDLTAKFDWRAIFGNDHPVEIDIGAGDGSFVVALAAEHPERNFVAIERLLGRVRKIAKRAMRQDLRNLRVLRLEAAFVVRFLIAPGSVEGAYLLFPDPWPKRRHHKNRIVQAEFARDIATLLAPGGRFIFRTDHEEYFHHAQPILEAEPLLQPWPDAPHLSEPHTDFERQWALEGRPTHLSGWRRV